MNKPLIIIITFFAILLIGTVTLIIEKAPENKKKGVISGNYSVILIKKMHIDMGNTVFFVTNNSKEFYISTFNWSDGLWEYAEITDSIIKRKGDLFLTVKKRNGKEKIFFIKDNKRYGFLIGIFILIFIGGLILYLNSDQKTN